MGLIKFIKMNHPISSKLIALGMRQLAPLSTSTRAMAAGDTGSPKVGGSASADAFTQREKSNEDFHIRSREREKLLELKKRISEQHDHLRRLEEHLDELSNMDPGAGGGGKK
ncbi:BgTH12-05593 [Blumeria graminis f. sp. triticale]|uniref:ATPase inhibitor, mitochondrial n=4 Tax=Blumeria graminis TaxID=34373 RepID=A0A656KKV0_BLUGR|nr:hypothetical protein BGT96224_4059 [Blumeria graminis f. sp. tritici 96224]CAD6503848.1 BgTH12-05593 [Blumeria graminis f. sp. triticale]VDB90525.1 Bgt-4059 [Blumeria graminis f. sp. tritici]